jgi:hypothetical protein
MALLLPHRVITKLRQGEGKAGEGWGWGSSERFLKVEMVAEGSIHLKACLGPEGCCSPLTPELPCPPQTLIHSNPAGELLLMWRNNHNSSH